MIARRIHSAIAVGLVLLAVVVGSQSGQAQQVSTALASKAPEAATIATMAQANGHVRIIVQHQASDGPGHRTLHTSNENLPLILEENRGAQESIVTTHFGALAGLAGPDRALRLMEITPAFAINATAAEIEALANDPRVLSIVVDKVERPILIQSVPLIGMTSAYSNYNATGTGFAVAIIDSGVDKTHTFLANVILEACYSTNTGTLGSGGSASTCPGGVSSSTAAGSGINCNIAWSDCEHGTHVAGIAAGNNTQFQSGQPPNGVAKSSGIIAIKAASEFTGADCGSAPSPCIAFWDSDMQAALDHVYAIRNSLPTGYQGVASVNMSIGGGDFSSNCDSANTSFKSSIDNLLTANIATVVAAGNDSKTNQISFPACISSAIAVASSSKNDVIAAYSNINSQVAVFAPGGDFSQPVNGAADDIILSSVPVGLTNCNSIGYSFPGPSPTTGGTYCYLAGTSMATPHVAGAFAAIRSALPNATVAQILSALESTGISIADTRSGGTITKPRIRVDLALQSLTSSPAALQVSPTTNISSSGLQGGAFSPSSFNYTVSATSGTRTYSISGVPSWLTASSTSGTVNTTGTTVTFSVNASANSLPPATYSTTITFTDTTSNTTTLTINATLTVTEPSALQVTPVTNIASVGNPGGPFSPSSFQYQLSTNNGTVNYSISGLPTWLNVSSGSGTATVTPTTITFTINSNANSLPIGAYNATISFSNTTNAQGNQTRNAALTVSSGGTGPPAMRTWVSSTGSDSNDCTLTAPCLTFAGAISKTAAGGEINVLDPGGFGAVTITKAITISSEGFEAGVLVSGTNGIVVNAPGGEVILRGLDIEGLGTGINGVDIIAASAVHIEKCVIRAFNTNSSNGVLVAPSAGTLQLKMDDVIVTEDGGPTSGNAIKIQPSGGAKVNATFNNVRLVNNASGFRFDGTNGPISAELRDSLATSSARAGLSAIGTNVVNVLSDHSAFTANGSGVIANGTGVSIRLTRTAVTGNTTGLTITSGAIGSYLDNEIDNNTSDGPNPSTFTH